MKKVFGALSLVGCIIPHPLQASLPPPAELITNGDFETGDFSGWTVDNLLPGDGDWSVYAVGWPTPISGHPTLGNVNGGFFYAVSDQEGPGTHALSQTFTVPGPATSVVLSFEMFVNDWDAGPIIDPIGLDHSLGPNQHARVDVLAAGSPAFDTTIGVLSNLYLGVDLGPDPNPFSPYVFDITGLVGAGGTFTLRFAESDNQTYFNQGVDNVSIQFTPIPEPTTFALLSLGSLALVMVRRRR